MIGRVVRRRAGIIAIALATTAAVAACDADSPEPEGVLPNDGATRDPAADSGSPETAASSPADDDAGERPSLEVGRVAQEVPGRYPPFVVSHTLPDVVFATDVDTDVVAVELIEGYDVARWSGHTTDITDMAVASDDTLVTGDFDTAVRVWRPSGEGQVGDPFAAHSAEVHSVAIGEFDGRQIVLAGGRDGVVRMWDVETRDEIAPPLTDHPGPVTSMALATLDGTDVVVTASEATLHVWDLATGQRVGEPLVGHLTTVHDVVVTGAADQVIAVSGSSDRTVRRWDLRSGEQIGEPLTGHEGYVLTVAVGDVGGRAVIAAGSSDPDRAVYVWDLQDGATVGELVASHSFDVETVAFSELDGHQIVLSAGLMMQATRVWSP